ncbi:tRNA pseudouridine(38-40) synthase TruA [Caldanaerobius polysaccharolyticus]|uniref:tRNA pseudouridine(38-40) synthase TruA n=1 Tax=Caldanaerobius polysaccharolyticus TaxID=44256 RepID=UPI000479EFBD|nr:tRNA pseudouridine(38-40) synthase TruA [Caldanaerobius polysaccharolyticus]
MSNIKLIVEYDGTHYHGWQYQLNAKTVQGEMLKAIKKITGEDVNLIGAGRTDAGVHAIGQVANFKSNSSVPISRLPYALNSVLPDDIVVKAAEKVDDSFHARKSAIGKEYRYYILNSELPSALLKNRVYHYKYRLDLDAMKRGAELFIGTHDFSAFKAAGSNVESSVRTIKRLDLNRIDELIELVIQADGFLYNMVRIITGTLIWVGNGKLMWSDVRDVINSRDRSKAGPTVPPYGLYLYKVFY